MAIYYKFRSEKEYNSVSIEGPFITVGNLKNKINESKIFKTRNSRYVKDVLVYVDDQTLIPKCASVVICRFPRFPCKPIVLFQETADEEEDSKTSISEDKKLYGTDFDDFGEDLFEVPKVAPLISGNPANPLRKPQALANTAALDRPQTTGGGFVGGLAGQGYGRDRYEWLKPPKGYVCHRCKIPGHFIQHCPTNGDPNFDIQRVIPPTGIPKSMLTEPTDGLHAKTNGVMKPNVAAFEMEMEGIVSTCNVSDLPELNCPLCKKVMEDAALTSKCCFRSFCDKCIRDQFISKRTCVCGATDRLADELLPNKTLRETINRRIETKYNSAGSHDQGKEFAPLVSSKDKKSCVTQQEPLEITKGTQQEPLEITKAPDVPESNKKALASEGRALPADKEGQHKQVVVEAANKKKRTKADSHMNVFLVYFVSAEIQGSTPPNIATQSYMTPGGSLAYNPYWNGMHPGMTAYMHPYYMAANCNGQFGVPGMTPPKTGPHRDIGEPGMRMNDGAPTTSREESKACKSESRQKHGLNRGVQSRVSSKDQKSHKEVRSSADVTSSKYQESRREVSSSADVTSRKLKHVRNFVINILFIIFTYCTAFGNFIHSGNLLSKYNRLLSLTRVEPSSIIFMIHLCWGHYICLKALWTLERRLYFS
ncbi:DWNN domain-containing protein [Artemisia annua]|uniref:DWNN domain-containing protein n=1 Tax=Artemisia annua TaxID=35608 RepID=A0A2U1N6Z2_ARTAN|nr:DWNN domain-containing protein [Artemisia annua]